jgi:hypothetical protein
VGIRNPGSTIGCVDSVKPSGAAHDSPPPRVTVRGAVPEGVVTAARDELAAVAGQARGKVSAVTARLTQERAGTKTQPGRPAVAQFNLTVDGRPLRVQTTAATAGKAVGLAVERLRELVGTLERRGGHRMARSAHPRPDRRWPDVRPAERKVVRRKAYPLMAQTPDEAAATLEALDYDFHLFTDAESGSDSVIYRGAPDGYLLAQATPGRPTRRPGRIPLLVSAIPAPRLTLPQARKELGDIESSFLFFTDEDTGRGNVLYRRYDGDYGLIMPAS